MFKLFGKVFGVASYKNSKGVVYYLHSKIVTLKSSNKHQEIFYFARKVNENTVEDRIPEGFIVIENKRTGLPMLKRG